MVGLMVTSKRVYTKGNLPRLLLLVPLSLWWGPPDPCFHRRPPNTSRYFGSVSSGVTSPFLWVLVCARFLLYPPRLESCFLQFCGSLVIKSCWPSRSDSLGIPSPAVRTPGWKPDVGFRIFTTVGELLWYYYFPVCGSPTWQVWDLFLP